MNKEMKYLLILLSAVFNLGVFAQADFQKGYVQINEKDTLFGLIKYNNDIANHNGCLFKKSETDTPRKFLPGEIFGYRFTSGKYYITKEVTNEQGVKNIFAEYLLKGTINLFYYRDDFGDHYLLQKAGTPLKEISYNDKVIYKDGVTYSRDYFINRALTKYYLQDCPEVFGAIDDIENPSQKGLVQLLKKYHNIKCPGQVCIIYSKTPPKFRMDLQPVFGFVKAGKEYAMEGYAETDYTSQFGLLTYIWLPLSNERLYFKSGLLFSRIKELDVSNSDLGHSDLVYVRDNNFKIPLQLQYVFLKHTLSPTFGGGLNVLITNNVPLSFFPSFNMGLNVKIDDTFYISLFADMDYAGKYFIIPDKTTYLVSNSFNVGFTFKL